MENLAQLAPLIVLIPAVGAIINFFWGRSLGEKASGLVGTTAAALSFVVAVALYLYLSNSNYEALVVNPPLLDGWIRIGSELEIPWQFRIDTLSVAMMSFVTFVGTLIHIYARGYMHGDPRFPRFFAYLNMFLAFMLILVTGNNFLMMFVGWEGVGLCSYLLIGFWWEKPNGVGWSNANAARKAFIVNRIGDFGVLMAIFLIFWAFGTLDFYKPGEITNPDAGLHHSAEVDHGEDVVMTEDADDHAESEDHGEEAATAEGDHGGESHDAAMEEHSAENEHATDDHSAPAFVNTFGHRDAIEGSISASELGVYGQVEYLVALEDSGKTIEYNIGGLNLSLETLLVLITLFLLLGATGKSAQLPLMVWLPDAMAGPTPVSALIHAATMVTAGVYMMVRSNVLFYNAEFTSFVVTIVGASTALVAGFIAVAQFDIKRVLAYSTISQLGFMVTAVGIGAYPAAMFHMITHAFFKALLFLGSGSVIHGVEHGHHHVHDHGDHDHDAHEQEHDHDDFDPQDMRNMGGLRHKMPITYWTYVIGTLALAGIFPFAGFWSKDEILADAWQVGLEGGGLTSLKGYIALGMLLVAAGFTAFYMWRQVAMVFHGSPRTTAAEHAHESTASMTWPLIILAFFSLFVGFINTPSGIVFFTDTFGAHRLGDWLERSVLHAHIPPFQLMIALSALTLGLVAIVTAGRIYGNDKALNKDGKDPLQASPDTSVLWGFAHARLWFDEIYFKLFENPYNKIAAFFGDVVDWGFLHDYFHDRVILRGYNSITEILGRPVDLGLVDGAVNGVGRSVVWVSGLMRRLQTGYVRTYTLALLLGAVFVIILMLLPLI